MAENSEQKKDKRPIVCGTDFSATAVEAVDLAAAMAKRLGTKFVLVHVEEFRGMAEVDPTLAPLAPAARRARFGSINLLSNFNLLMVVAVSFGLQVWSQHSAMLATFLKTSLIPMSDCLMLLAISAVPLLALEAVKSFTRKNR